MKCIFSVDVEDWFHILDSPATPDRSKWDLLPSRVESNFGRLLEIFDENRVRVTCFFLGWVAQRFPHLVKESDRRGHEVASHGYGHRLAYEMTAQDFYEDALTSKRIIEDIVGHPIWGYRSPGFSLTKRTPWFFDKLIEAGYRYDSSVFPAQREHGGLEECPCGPYRVVDGHSEGLLEFPVTVARVLGKRVCFFGGGYLRLFPLSLIRRMAFKVLGEGRPVIFYIHPREIDPCHPRLAMDLRRKFKSYVNLKTTEAKIKRLLAEFEFTTFKDFITDNQDQFVSGHGPAAAVGSAAGVPAEQAVARRV